MADEFLLTSLAVGHGDAILGRWCPSKGRPFTFLVDGGPKAASDRTITAISAAAPDGLDLAVLSHVDADHIDGLLEIAGELSIGSYWGPCLAAFERYSWLFPERVQVGLRKARELEDLLRDRGTQLLCPVEGWADRSPDGGLEIQVLNPPGKLYERLLVQDDGLDLLLEHPTPLGWLFEVDDHDSEEIPDIVRTRQFLRETRAFDPRELPHVVARSSISEAEREEAIRRYVALSDNDVEFFGTSCLNDTSIVLWIGMLLDGQHRRTLLLPGDLENWLYVLGRNARGLIVDVLKAPHHGGRMYVDRKVAYDDVLQVIRPAATIVSANGSHNLPRTAFRDAVSRWSRALFCPCTRSREILTGTPESDHSTCNTLYRCGTAQRSVTLRFRSDMIESDVPACSRTPGGDSVPIVQIRQHIVDPSPSMDRLVEGELRKHVMWTRSELARVHVDRTKLPQEGVGDRPVAAEHLATLARQDGRHALANRHLRFVLSEGWKRHSFWSSRDRHALDDGVAYILPNDDDLKAILSWLDSLLFIGLGFSDKTAGSVDRSTLLAAAATRGLAEEVSAKFRFPAQMFNETIWPTVSKHLESWQIFVARSGYLVLFSQSDSLDALNDRLSVYPVVCGNGSFFSVDSYGRDATTRDLDEVPIFGRGTNARDGQPTTILSEILKVRQRKDRSCFLSLIPRFFYEK